MQYLGKLYEDQKELLDALHEKEAIEIFVAAFSGLRKESNTELFSYCVWSRDVDTLLPKTQLIMLNSGDDSMSICEWDRVFEVAGDLFELDEDRYPVRYLVTDFPSPQQIAEIGEIEL